jgi:hypothetical protein
LRLQTVSESSRIILRPKKKDVEESGKSRKKREFPKVENATALIWKMLQVAESTFRRLKGAELLPAVYAGAQCVDGMAWALSTQKMAA